MERLCGEATAPHRPEAAGAPSLLSATAQLCCHAAFGYPKGPRAGERDRTVPLRVCSLGPWASNQVRHMGAMPSADTTQRWDWQGGSTHLTIGLATWESTTNAMKGQQKSMTTSSSIGCGAQQRLGGEVWGAGGEREVFHLGASQGPWVGGDMLPACFKTSCSWGVSLVSYRSQGRSLR